ncbi:PTS glucose transporter subunit IIA [Mycolicibacterium madagascariense]|uniref:PTS glucose transporter subunit IIA n=1 Tax=Mycolicibacterium madagascariense TaxID=212765 RepID=A0A7I7XDK5_9MYCO|nr:glucose PTS transporter subunit IIA [Mycolicibacterium madagascariense]MCV7015192.1 PTS glucose transporter subunit IIA [Mycolicibacterium madagascariense]BBZ27485.1 PTS glucose transporter subunit IIA [Mycolicibacterium madagascariense]
MSPTRILAPVPGRAIALRDVPDPVFSQGMVGYGAAIEPPHQVLDAVAPVGGAIVRLLPHAYVVMTADGVGVLVHLGLDTVALKGEGFTVHVEQGDQVSAGQRIVTYDVPAIVAKGLRPVVPVVVMDEREEGNVVPAESVGTEIACGTDLFTVNS